MIHVTQSPFVAAQKGFVRFRKSQTFVVQVLDAATQYANLMPRCLDVNEAKRDLALFEALHPVLQSINQLKELVEDTQMLAGSEAYEAARVAYVSIKISARAWDWMK